MITAAEVIVLGGCGACAAWLLRRRNAVAEQFQRLTMLWEQSEVFAGNTDEELDWARSAEALDSLKDRFGKAGLLT